MKYAPGDPQTLLDFATFLQRRKPPDNGRALQLLQTYMRLVPYSVSALEQIANLQLNLPQGTQRKEALVTINKAISVDPMRSELYKSRENIEQKLGFDEKTCLLHLAEGYRNMGDRARSVGQPSTALTAYLRGLQRISAFESSDDEVRMERAQSVRNISLFLEEQYSRAHAIQFWRTVAGSKTAVSFDIANAEATRLAGLPAY